LRGDRASRDGVAGEVGCVHVGSVPVARCGNNAAMATIEVAYGIPAHVPAERLLAALADVAEIFDERPARMHALLGPPDRGVRWLTFASSSFGPDRVMSEGHFVDVMSPHVPELIVAARSHRGEPWRFQAPDLELGVEGERVVVRRGVLADDARRDGAIDQIGLGAIGLADAIRPFAALDAPTHEVILRDDHRRPSAIAIIPYTGDVLSVGVAPQRIGHGAPVHAFPLTPRRIDEGNAAELAAVVEAAFVRAEAGWIRSFEATLVPQARALARAGGGVVPLLVSAITSAKPKPRSTRLAIAALGLLADPRGAPSLVPYAAKSSEVFALAGSCALAAHGPAARGALEAACASKKRAERAVGEALIPLLDARDWAPVRAVRAARDATSRPEVIAAAAASTAWSGVATIVDAAALAEFLRAIDNINPHSSYDAALAHGIQLPDAMWAVALHLVETPVDAMQRQAIMRACAARLGAALGPVADLLLRFPPFADDPVMLAIARGAAVPSHGEVIARIQTKAKRS